LKLNHDPAYAKYGLDPATRRQLSLLGDLILGAGFNVSGVRDHEEIERTHFLDSLSVLSIGGIAEARDIADIGSGAGFPALVLALALPSTGITAVESIHKKCAHIQKCAAILKLHNVDVRCMRAEEYGHTNDRESYDVVVSRAVASLPVVCEYSMPLLRTGGLMVAMKTTISDQERIQGVTALGILGADLLDVVELEPFEGSHSRRAYVARKTRSTPSEFPRRAGIPSKRPLGQM